MASTSVPWIDVSPRDFVRSAEAGASEGQTAARIQQSAIAEQARTALEAQGQANQIAEANARLSQQERLAQMENEVRKDIANKAALRQQQEIEVDKARNEAMAGIAKSRLQQQQDIATAKAQQAARVFADTRDFAKAVDEGMHPAAALYRFTNVHPTVVTALSRHEPPIAGGPLNAQEVLDKNGKPIPGLIAVPGPGGRMSVRNLPKQPESQTAQGPGIIDRIGDFISGKMIKSGEEVNPPLKAFQGIEPPDSGESTAPAKSRVERAKELHAQHPSWTKDQIIKAVNDEFSR